MNLEKIQISITRATADKRFYVFDLQANSCYNVKNFVDPYTILNLQQYRLLKWNYCNIKVFANFLWSRYRVNSDIPGMTNTVQAPATTHLQASMLPQFPKVYIYWQRGPGLDPNVFNSIKSNTASDDQITQFLEEGRGITPLAPSKRYANINYQPPKDARRYVANPFQSDPANTKNGPISAFYNNWKGLAPHNADYVPETPLFIVDTKYWKNDVCDLVIDLNIKGTLSMTGLGMYSKNINTDQPVSTTVDENGIKIQHTTINKGQHQITYEMIRDLIKEEPLG